MRPKLKVWWQTLQKPHLWPSSGSCTHAFWALTLELMHNGIFPAHFWMFDRALQHWISMKYCAGMSSGVLIFSLPFVGSRQCHCLDLTAGVLIYWCWQWSRREWLMLQCWTPKVGWTRSPLFHALLLELEPLLLGNCDLQTLQCACVFAWEVVHIRVIVVIRVEARREELMVAVDDLSNDTPGLLVCIRLLCVAKDE